MKFCRWTISLFCSAVFLGYIGMNIPTYGQDKKEEKKGEEKKAEEKKGEEKKTEEKKGEEKKAEPKQEPKQTETPKSGGTADYKAFEPKSKEFFQTVTTKTEQKMTVNNQTITQNQNQTFYIKLEPKEKKGEDYVVEQTIIGVKMDISIGGNQISFDSTAANPPANPMSDFFKALIGSKLKLTIGKDLKVKSIEGTEDLIKNLGGTNQQMTPLLQNILNEKALKNMTEPTLAAFPLSDNKEWKNKTDLELGGIGRYITDFTYKLDGGDKKKVNIEAKMTYEKPSDSKGLPFKIKSANLESKEGNGSATINAEKGRVESSTMKMKLAGDLTIEVGGQETKVDLVQEQVATMSASDTSPIQQASAPATKEKK